MNYPERVPLMILAFNFPMKSTTPRRVGRRRMVAGLCAVTFASCFVVLGAGGRRFSQAPDLPLRTSLPDPLVMLDGRKVATRETCANGKAAATAKARSCSWKIPDCCSFCQKRDKSSQSPPSRANTASSLPSRRWKARPGTIRCSSATVYTSVIRKRPLLIAFS